jgi:hypothetical protein
LFNLVTHLDLTFKEIREILDYLLEAKAFPEGKNDPLECGHLYDIRLGRVHYVVDVLGYEIVVYQRSENPEP